MNLVHDFLLIFVPLFVVVDPAGTLPVFLALTGGYTEPQRRRIARRATVVAGITGCLFVIVGQAVFTFLGIQFTDFQIAGGILLVILAILDLLSPGKPAVDEALPADPGAHVGIVPLAVPLIVGPATMTTSLLLVNTFSAKYEAFYGAKLGITIVATMVCIALLLNLAILFTAMFFSGKIVALVGKNTMAVLNKIVMILLAAIAVSLIRQGIVSIVHDLKTPETPAITQPHEAPQK